MRIGGYIIVVEGDDSKEYSAIDSLSVPTEGREVLLAGSLYIVTRVRTEQDLEEQSEPEKIHTYPRVFVKRVGEAPTPTRPPDPDSSDTKRSGPSLVRLEVIPLSDYRATDIDERAEVNARAAHEVQRAQIEQREPVARVFVRRVDHQATDADELAEERAEAAHRVQQILEEQRSRQK
jgi:hypothetical protein